MTSSHDINSILRIEDKLLQKITYIASYDGRTIEQEIDLMIKEWIRAFEDFYGEIIID